MQDFKNKRIWITGASSGIGKELALQLATLGASVIVSARNAEALEQLKTRMAFPEKCYVLPLDLSQHEHFSDKVQEAIGAFGSIDLLINNAGLSQRSHVSETSMAVHRKLMEVNYFGTVGLTQEILPHFRKQGGGHIAVTSSLAGKFGFYERSAYAASKFALHGYFETLRLEEESNHIYVTLLCPGGIKTDISKHALDGSGKPFGKMSPLQENGMPADQCAKHMIDAIAAKKQEVIIGQGMERISVKMKGLWPAMFWKLIKGRKPA
jgi:short-subunit dehydrogenase